MGGLLNTALSAAVSSCPAPSLCMLCTCGFEVPFSPFLYIFLSLSLFALPFFYPPPPFPCLPLPLLLPPSQNPGGDEPYLQGHHQSRRSLHRHTRLEQLCCHKWTFTGSPIHLSVVLLYPISLRSALYSPLCMTVFACVASSQQCHHTPLFQ